MNEYKFILKIILHICFFMEQIDWLAGLKPYSSLHVLILIPPAPRINHTPPPPPYCSSVYKIQRYIKMDTHEFKRLLLLYFILLCCAFLFCLLRIGKLPLTEVALPVNRAVRTL